MHEYLLVIPSINWILWKNFSDSILGFVRNDCFLVSVVLDIFQCFHITACAGAILVVEEVFGVGQVLGHMAHFDLLILSVTTRLFKSDPWIWFVYKYEYIYFVLLMSSSLLFLCFPYQSLMNFEKLFFQLEFLQNVTDTQIIRMKFCPNGFQFVTNKPLPLPHHFINNYLISWTKILKKKSFHSVTSPSHFTWASALCLPFNF